MIYKGEYADEDAMVITHEDSDKEAIEFLLSFEGENGILFNAYELDEDYNEIRIIW